MTQVKFGKRTYNLKNIILEETLKVMRPCHNSKAREALWHMKNVSGKIHTNLVQTLQGYQSVKPHWISEVFLKVFRTHHLHLKRREFLWENMKEKIWKRKYFVALDANICSVQQKFAFLKRPYRIYLATS